MSFSIITRPAQQIAAIRVVGPYTETIPAGFSRLASWTTLNQLCQGDWLALYWDNPNLVAADALRSDVAISVPDAFILPPGTPDEIQLQEIPAGQYAVYQVRVTDGDYAKAWQTLYGELLPASGYEAIESACFEQYLNDCTQDGYADIAIHQAVHKL